MSQALWFLLGWFACGALVFVLIMKFHSGEYDRNDE